MTSHRGPCCLLLSAFLTGTCAAEPLPFYYEAEQITHGVHSHEIGQRHLTDFADGHAVGFREDRNHSKARAFYYRDGEFTDIVPPEGYLRSFATAVTPDGVVYGYLQNRPSDVKWYLPETLELDLRYRPFRWQDGEMTLLDPIDLGGPIAEERFTGPRSPVVTREGFAVGSGLLEGATLGGFGRPTESNLRGFLYRDGETADLGNFGGGNNRPDDVNASGTVVGHAGDDAYIYESGELGRYDRLPEAHLTGINDHGDVVGTYLDEATDTRRGFIDRDGDVEFLGEVFPTSIANDGTVAGYMPGLGAFVRRDGETVLLDDMFPWIARFDSSDVTREGNVIARRSDWTEWALTRSDGGQPPPPVPEPASLLLAGLGVAGVGLARRRRSRRL